jgi:arylsulfate sulfotransferase
MGSVEQILTDVQGSGPVDVMGDMIMILDANMQLVWAWDTFDHLDVTRVATLNDKCTAGECPPVFLSADASNVNDWTHGNSVQQTPDGNLLYSARAQDMVYKIDYENGAGNGTVFWRLGNGGDFQIESVDASPWFSHQHDPQFLTDNSTMTLLDNGNTRNLADPTANSRGQVLQLDQQAMTAKLILNVDLGGFGVALGAAQHLYNQNYYFDSSFRSGTSTYNFEVTPSGTIVYSVSASAPEYRSFRLPDLYNPPFGTR